LPGSYGFDVDVFPSFFVWSTSIVQKPPSQVSSHSRFAAGLPDSVALSSARPGPAANTTNKNPANVTNLEAKPSAIRMGEC
jgi:hypothetical protein